MKIINSIDDVFKGSDHETCGACGARRDEPRGCGFCIAGFTPIISNINLKDTEHEETSEENIIKK